MGKLQRDVPEGVLALECEAFLSGTLAEFWEEHGTAVPVWTWTNLLAHGTESQIRDSLRWSSKLRRTGRSWRMGRAYLAYKMLDLACDELMLDEIQCAVMLPLELELARCPEVDRWTPRRWIDTVGAALRSQHSSLGL